MSCVLRFLLVFLPLCFLACSSESRDDGGAVDSALASGDAGFAGCRGYEFDGSSSVFSMRFCARGRDVFIESYMGGVRIERPVLLLFSRERCHFCVSELIVLLNVKRSLGVDVVMLGHDAYSGQLEGNHVLSAIDSEGQFYFSSFLDTFIDDFVKRTGFVPRSSDDPLVFMLGSDHKLLKVYEGILIEERFHLDIKRFFCGSSAVQSHIACSKL